MIFLYRKIRKAFHIVSKFFAIFCFGIGSLVIAYMAFPIIDIFIGHRVRARRIKQGIIRVSFRVFVDLMRYLRLISLKIDNMNTFKNVREMIICANHPSLIDVVILLSVIPRADCIVKARLWHNVFVKRVIGRLYISNSLNVEDTIAKCNRSLRQGNNLVIFPEGTRTVDHKNIKLQRSAAQISLRTGFSILPVKIYADSPIGLRKGDPPLTAPESGIIRYRLTAENPIEPKIYKELPTAKAARLLTQDLKRAIIIQQ